MKKKYIITIILVLISILVVKNYAFPSVKEGDIVFQISKSNQSPYIILATKSPWSHCGIIIEKDNELYVLEASNKVKLTPYKDWKKKGRGSIISTKRIFSKMPHKIKYKQYLGKDYDLSFKLDNNKYYCSELVWHIYKYQFDTIIAKPHPVSDYNITNKKALKLMKSRGITNEQMVIAPCDLK